MKRVTATLFVICLSLTPLFAGEGAPVSANEPLIPQPLTVDSKDVSAVVIVPDLIKVIEKAEAIAMQFAPPGQMPPGTLKASLGMQFNDPNLAELVPGKPIILMVLAVEPEKADIQKKPFAVFVPTKAAAPYDAVLKQQGLQVDFADGILVVASDDDSFAKAKTQRALYAKLSEAAVNSDVRAFANLERLAATYGQKLEQTMKDGLANMPMAPMMLGGNPEALKTVLQLYAKLGMGLLNQTALLQADLNLKADEVAWDVLYGARPNSAMFDALKQAPAGESPTLKYLTASELMAGSFRFNAESYAAFQNKLLDELKADPAAAELVTEDMVNVLKAMVADFTGEMALGIAASKDKQQPPDNNFVMSVKNGDGYLQGMVQLGKLMDANGAIGKFYANLGIKLKSGFQRDARKYKDVAVHALKMEADTEGMPPMQADQIKRSMKNSEFAIVKNLLLMSSSPATLDAMVDKALLGEAAKADVTLQSYKIFGPGRQMYFDYDVLATAAATMAGTPMAMLFGNIKPGDPVVAAISFGDGRAYAQTKVSLKPYINFMRMVAGALGGPGGAAPGGRQPGVPPPPPLIEPEGKEKKDAKKNDGKGQF